MLRQVNPKFISITQVLKGLSNKGNSFLKQKMADFEIQCSNTNTSSFTTKLERDKYLNMDIEDKRLLYKNHTYLTVDKIETWEQYFLKNKDHLLKQCQMHPQKFVDKGQYDIKPELNNKISVWKGDITHLEIDAIVNAANESLRGGGGVDGAIHSAAGPDLLKECIHLGGCAPGDAKITGGYKLPAKYIIHTVGPRGEYKDVLKSCYNTCLDIMRKENLRTIAFPCISTGVFGYPQRKAALVALENVRDFLERYSENVDRIIFCLFLSEDLTIYGNLLQNFFPVE